MQEPLKSPGYLKLGAFILFPFPPIPGHSWRSSFSISHPRFISESNSPFNRVTIQSRVARNKFCWGLGVRAVRAGSIGREDPRLEVNTASPKWGAGGLGPRLLHEDPSAL